jgi:putative DNA primase/helicase
VNPTAFFQNLFGNDAAGHLPLWTRQDKKTYWFPASNLEAAGRLAERLASTHDVYCSVALQDKEAAFARWRAQNTDKSGEPATRGYSETAVALPGLWTDIDVRGPAHRSPNLPPTKEAARALLTEFPLAPTLVVDSGHGLQGWWLFRELWIFESAAERQKAQDLARNFLATLQAKAQAHGWQVDSVADLARLMRIPGTVNHKLALLPVQIIERNV